MTTLILGLGNLLLRDEGVGIHVIHHLESSPPPGATLLDGGTLGFTLIPLLDDAHRLILIDAANLQETPGTLQTFHDQEMDAQWQRLARNAHQIGLADWLTLAPLRGRTLPPRTLIAIQPGEMTWGDQLTPAVAAAVSLAAATVRELLTALPPSA